MNTAETRRKKGRSRLTNGSTDFLRGDGRSYFARRFKDVRDLLIAELGGKPTELEMGLIRTAATLRVRLEDMDARMSKGEDIDLGTYALAVGHLRRVLADLGIKKKVSKDPGPSSPSSLDEYLAEKKKERAA